MDLKLKIAAIVMPSENGLTDGANISYLRYRLPATELTSKAIAGTLHVIHCWACLMEACIGEYTPGAVSFCIAMSCARGRMNDCDMRTTTVRLTKPHNQKFPM